jgi:hypothetical protein
MPSRHQRCSVVRATPTTRAASPVGTSRGAVTIETIRLDQHRLHSYETYRTYETYETIRHVHDPLLAVTNPVVLVRYRAGEVGRAHRDVHQMLPTGQAAADVWTARCGEELEGARCEQVEPGTGMPCVGCLMAS